MKKSKLSYDMCQDLIVEIFTWLPVKSLLRFRSVSKSLCGCIGSPDFIRLHTLRSPEKLMIVQKLNHEGVDNPCSRVYTLHSESQLSSSPYTSEAAVECPFTDFEIVGSSNGIICLFEYGKDGINLWNPSIRRKLTAQDRPSWRPTKFQFSYVFGFGYDPIIDDYKILRYTKSDTQNVYSVYTLKTDTWCEIRGPAPPYSYVYSRQCLFNGTLHWVVQYKLIDHSKGTVIHSHIMTFDLSTDVFSAIPLPEQSGVTSKVTIIKGFLALMSSENDNTWIWVRREESWSVAFNINTTGIERAYKVMQLIADGDLVLQSYTDEILVYNPETHVKSRLDQKFKGSKRLHAMELCIEGLGLLHMGTPC